MSSLKLSKDVSKRSKAKEKGKNEKKRPRIAQLDDEDMFSVSLFTGDGSKTDKSGSREIKVREAREQGTESGGGGGGGLFAPSQQRIETGETLLNDSAFIYTLVTFFEVLKLPTFTRIPNPHSAFTQYPHLLTYSSAFIFSIIILILS